MKTFLAFIAFALPLSLCWAQKSGAVAQRTQKLMDSSVILNVVTVPQGAMVSSEGVDYGESPARVVFSADAFARLKKPDGCVLAAFELQWPSGAKGKTPDIRMCHGTGTDYRYVAQRPKDAPQPDKDDSHAAERSKESGTQTRYLAQPVRKESGATTVFVTIHTDPQNADIFAAADSRLIGRAPVRLHYSRDARVQDPGACTVDTGLEVRWLSGAVAKPLHISLCGGNDTDYELTIARPKDVPRPDIDQNYAAVRTLELRNQKQTAVERLRHPQARPQAQAAAHALAPPPAVQQRQAQAINRPPSTPDKTTLTLTTVPEGAEIFENGISLGRSPRNVSYDPATLKGGLRADGCTGLATLEARWPSGATAKAEGLSMCQGTEKDYSWTFQRPLDAPGLSVDQNFSAQLALQRMQQDQANQQALWKAQQAQQQADAQARARAEIDSQEGSEALLKGLLSLIPQTQPTAPAATPEPAPFGIRPPLRCVTKNRFGRLETECQ